MYYLSQNVKDNYANIWELIDDHAVCVQVLQQNSPIPQGYSMQIDTEYQSFFDRAPRSEDIEELIGIAALGKL